MITITQNLKTESENVSPEPISCLYFEDCVCFVGMGGPVSGTSSYLGTFLRRWPKIGPYVAVNLLIFITG